MPSEMRIGLLRNGNPQGDPMTAPRCGARTRKGKPCQQPAMANGRCRMHGGRSTGPRTPEGIERIRQSRTKHGLYTKQAMAMRRYMRNLLKDSRETLRQAL